MEFQRRQSAGARVGHDVPLQHREGARPGGRSLPRAVVPGPDAELQLVGQPKGPAGAERVCRRLPRARQHRRVRSQRRAADRWPSRPGGRHGVDGVLLPEHAGNRAHPQRDGSDLRRGRLSVPRALPLDHVRHGSDGRPPRRDVGQPGRILLRPAAPAEWRGDAIEGPIDGRPAAAVRLNGVRTWAAQTSSAHRGAHRAVQEAPPGGAGADCADR